ncbi:2593_t:CDS:2 [Ambispora leptoticha]|uniref:2593_t:CDS:1 n=1 Tax=Ambispora leptoticha TaxID=144679 RepID=A0A9N8VRP4_9GLOM|nr:2593_t:CDS:2 [Ambispora leptoticha]
MNYEITSDVITVTLSDGNSFEPSDPAPEEGVVSYFRLVKRNDPSDLVWRHKLGEGLVLLLNEKKGTNIELPKKLKAFPRGYVLYEHYKVTEKSEKSERHDKYLYGFGEKRFRSPNEFVPHLYWLATNREGKCLCKICTGATLTPQLVEMSRISGKNTTEPKRVVKTTKGRSVLHIKAPLFRVGEIIWFNICQASDYKLASFGGIIDFNNSNIKKNSHLTKYWPCVVHRVQKRNIENSYDFEFRYTIRLLALSLNEAVPERALRPWTSHQPQVPTSIFTSTKSKNDIIETSRDTLNGFIQAYKNALSTAQQIVQSYYPMKPYSYSESQEGLNNDDVNDTDRTYMRQMSAFPHFREIFVGVEKIREFDFLRLYSDNVQPSASAASTSFSTSKDEYSSKKDNYFMVSTIFYNHEKGIQFTGDLYEMAEPIINNPQYIEDFQWIPLNEQYEEYTIDLSDVMGRFYVSFPHLNHPMSIHHNYMKTENERNKLLDPDAPPLHSQLENENLNAEIDRLMVKSLYSKVREKHSIQVLQSSQSSKRHKINSDSNKGVAKEPSGKSFEEALVIDSDSSDENTDIYHMPRKSNTSTRSVLKDSIAIEDNVNSGKSISWRSKIMWPKSPDGRTLLAAPDLNLQIPPEMNWNFGLEIRTISFPIVSNRNCNIFEHFPQDLTISAISNLDPFEDYHQTMGDLVQFCLDPDVPFPSVNRLHFNTLAKILFANKISVVALPENLMILLKSDDGSNIIGLCSPVTNDDDVNAYNNRDTITNKHSALTRIKCINIKSRQTVTIDMSNVTTFVDLFHELSEAYNVSLHSTSPEDIRLRFFDKNQELYLILSTSSSPHEAYGDAIFGRNTKYTHSLDFVKQHATTLMFEL